MKTIFCALFLLAQASPGFCGKAEELTQEADKLFFRGRLTQAMQMYDKAVQEDPQFLQAYLNGSVALKHLGRLDQAAAILAKAEELNPRDPEILCELGWLYFHQGASAQARERFQKALELKADHPIALFGLGLALYQSGETQEAAKVLKKAADLRPSFAAARFFLGLAHEKLNDLEPAFEHVLASVKKDWTSAEARGPLARIYEKQGKLELSRQQYDNVLFLDPGNPEARTAFKKLAEKIGEMATEASSATALAGFTAIKPVAAASPKQLGGGMTSLKARPAAPSAAKIRVGLWTTDMGRPPQILDFLLTASGPFRIVGTKSGKAYGRGNSWEPWIVRYKKDGTASVLSPEGKEAGPFKHRIRFEPESSTTTFKIDSMAPYGKTAQLQGYQGREVRGALEVSARARRGLYAINELGLDEYLTGVLPAEMPSSWPLEAQKAQAVIARNQAWIRKKQFHPHRSFHYDLCDSQHCQVYKGVRAESAHGTLAVEQTVGEFLYFNGSPAYSYYHSNCGGHTLSSSELAGWGKVAYLTGLPDQAGPQSDGSYAQSPWSLNLWIKEDPPANCNLPEYATSSAFRWLRVVPRAAIERKLRKGFKIDRIKSIVLLGRGRWGHASEVLIQGAKRRIVLKKEHQIRHYLGMESLRSTLIVVEPHYDASGEVSEFWIYGGGWGHGVGFCQTGAAGLAARQGKNYEDILKFYFPGTVLRKAVP